MFFLDRLKISAKLALVLSLSGAALVAAMLLAASLLHRQMLADRENQSRRVVEMARSIVEDCYAKTISGIVSEDEAKATAIAIIRRARYGNNGYFFIQRYDGVTILNANRPDLEGRFRWNDTDPDGVFLVREEALAGKNGGGFVHYRFPRAGATDPVAKVSYVAGFDPWQWSIGSGVYIDDVETEFRYRLAQLVTLAFAIFGCAMLCAYFVNRNVGRSLRHLRDKMAKLADGDLTVEIGETSRRDEIGEMAKAMHVFKDNAVAAQQLEVEREKRRELEFAMNHADRVDSLGRLASGIAHDLNNALVPVLAMTKSVMLRHAKSSRDYANLDLALMGAQRARELVQQILAFGRKQAIEYRDFDIAPVVNDGVRMLRAILPSTIKLESAVEPVPTIHGDAGQINQVLVNLIVNSSHAIGDEPGTITVAVSRHDPAAVRLSVADTGCGMDEKTAARLFEPFFTTKEVGKGTGLGLSVVRGIVTSHGGTISVKSALGRGTQFDVILPIDNKGTGQSAESTDPSDAAIPVSASVPRAAFG